MGSQTITASGFGTWVAPAGLNQLTIQMWGAGGGGGGSNVNSTAGGSGGGGGGAYARITVTGLAEGNTFTYYVGGGGIGGPAGNNNGSVGRGSNFQNNTGGNTSLILGANGGAGGINAANTGNKAGIGGAANGSGGVTSYKGGNGANNGGSRIGAGAGAGAGNANAGADVPATTQTGATGANGGGNGGNGGSRNGNGNDFRSANGAGGGGAGQSNGTARKGGNGGNGAIILTWDNASNTSKSAYIKGTLFARYYSGAYKPFPNITVLDDFNRASLGSQWVVNDGSPSIYNNSVLDLAGANIQYASGVAWPVEFYMTISGFPTDPQFYHVYLDYNLHNGTGSTKTTYRYSFGFIHNDGALSGVELQKSVNDSAFTNIITTGAYTWPNGTPSVKFGLRHLDNGNITIYLDKGSGWEVKASGNDSSIIASGWWRLQGGTDTGSEYFDDFALGHPELGNGGKEAYIEGTNSWHGSSSKSAYINGTTVKNSSKSAFISGLNPNSGLVPDGLVSSTGTWKNELGSTSNLWESINEFPTPSDSDFIYREPLVMAGDYIEFSLTSPVGTVSSGNLAIFWRGRDPVGSTKMWAGVQFKQGSTILASGVQRLTSLESTYSFILPSGQRSLITDWNDLRLRITVVKTG